MADDFWHGAADIATWWLAVRGGLHVLDEFSGRLPAVPELGGASAEDVLLTSSEGDFACGGRNSYGHLKGVGTRKADVIVVARLLTLVARDVHVVLAIERTVYPDDSLARVFVSAM